MCPSCPQELCSTTLAHALKTGVLHLGPGQPDLELVLALLLDVAQGLEHLHAKNIMHGGAWLVFVEMEGLCTCLYEVLGRDGCSCHEVLRVRGASAMGSSACHGWLHQCGSCVQRGTYNVLTAALPSITSGLHADLKPANCMLKNDATCRLRVVAK